MFDFYGIVAHLVLGETISCGSVSDTSHQPDNMEANTGNQGRQATMYIDQNGAYTKLEAARKEENVALEPATSTQEETGVGQQGKSGHHSFDITLSSPRFSNACHGQHRAHPQPTSCAFHAKQPIHRHSRSRIAGTL